MSRLTNHNMNFSGKKKFFVYCNMSGKNDLNFVLCFFLNSCTFLLSLCLISIDFIIHISMKEKESLIK